MRSLPALIGATALLGLLVAGCGGTSLDSSGLETEVAEYARKSLHERVESVDCPSGEPVEKGRVLKCVVRLKGGGSKVAAMEIIDKKADVRVKHYGGANE
jgi:hypothetical protein